MQAVVEQVRRDHALLRARIERLGGPSGAARLEAALAAARAASAAASTAATTTPVGTPQTSPRRTTSARGAPASPSTSSPIKAAESAAALPQAVGDGSGIAAAGNETLMWELLYNLEWQMPMAELEALWKDALGESGAP